MAMWSTAERATSISLSPPSRPRLRLRPPRPAGSPRTRLDGGWWPRSADPVAELPGLILALQAALQADGPADDHWRDDHGRITHILLRVADWDSRPRRLRVDGPTAAQVVRLSWFDTLPAGLLTALCDDDRRVDLLTVPASTGYAAAGAAMESAAHDADNRRTPEQVAMLTAPTGPAAPTGADAATHSTQDAQSPQDVWESEGGRL